MVYEFWDMRTNNLIEAFDTEKDALSALFRMTEDQGDRAAEFLMLIEDDPEMDVSRILGIGRKLIDRAATLKHQS